MVWQKKALALNAKPNTRLCKVLPHQQWRYGFARKGIFTKCSTIHVHALVIDAVSGLPIHSDVYAIAITVAIKKIPGAQIYLGTGDGWITAFLVLHCAIDCLLRKKWLSHEHALATRTTMAAQLTFDEYRLFRHLRLNEPLSIACLITFQRPN